ncbi:dipeptidyl-peptidase III [Botrytis cinerea]
MSGFKSISDKPAYFGISGRAITTAKTSWALRVKLAINVTNELAPMTDPLIPYFRAIAFYAFFTTTPPFSSLYTSTAEAVEAYKVAVTEAGASLSTSPAAPEYVPVASDQSRQAHEASTSSRNVEAETKAALPQDTKGESSKKDDENEPPPAYSEGSSPLDGFTYLMAAAGGAASIITQVQQGAAPINTLGDVGADENITMDLRGTRFTLSRDEL